MLHIWTECVSSEDEHGYIFSLPKAIDARIVHCLLLPGLQKSGSVLFAWTLMSKNFRKQNLFDDKVLGDIFAIIKRTQMNDVRENFGSKSDLGHVNLMIQTIDLDLNLDRCL